MHRIINTLSYALALVGCGLILLAALVAVGNALSRGVFGVSIYGANDLLLMITFVGITACFPLAMRERIHMRVTLLGDALGTTSRIVLDTFASLLTLVFLAALSLRFFIRARELARYHEVSDIAGVVLAPWWWAAAALLAAAAVVQMWIVSDNPRHYSKTGRLENGATDD